MRVVALPLLLFASLASPVPAQRPGPAMPPPRMPLIPPPVEQPASLGQPGMEEPAPAQGGPKGRQPTESEKAAREFRGRKVEGKELKQAVGKVLKELHWYEQLPAALARSAATGKPVLWIQMLGDLDGFA